jgi:hypothetical protein
MLLLLAACVTGPATERVEPSFIEVTLDLADPGTEAAPLPFSTVTASIPVSVRTLDVHGDAWPFTGDLTVKSRPGIVDQDPKVSVTDGTWSGDIALRNGFGPTRLWFSDEGDKDEDSTRAASWSAGVSDPIWYARPTIGEVQNTTDHEVNQLVGEFAELRADDRRIVVTAVDAAGFWVADTMDDPGTANGMYVYTFGRPDDTVVPGARLTLLTGIDQEYLASTQLSYPTLAVAEGESYDVPAAIEVDGASGCGDDAMELLEGSRVRATGATIPSTFVAGSTEFDDFESYGQWPFTLGSCDLYAESGGTVPDWYPPDHAGETLPYVEGMLKEVYGKWIFLVLDADGIGAVTPRPDSRRTSRPRKAP